MENIQLWRYFVIGGPAFMLGCYITHRLMKSRYAVAHFIHQIMCTDKFETAHQDALSQKVMDGVAADAVYGRDE